MAIAVTQRFAVGATTVDIPFALKGGRSVPTRAQTVMNLWGGEVRVADRNVTWYITEMTVRMTTTTFALLLTFWDTTLKGAFTEMTWTDINGTAHALARALDRELPATKPVNGVVDVTLRIRTAEMVY